MTRELRLDGAALEVIDTIRNTSPVPTAVAWVQHPGFGAPFVDEHSVLRTSARTFVSDAEDPGNALAADTVSAFPHAAAAGAPIDLTAVPAPSSGRHVFGCLTDFDGAWFQIDSPTVGFGIRVDWDLSVLPHAWFWQECHATAGFPWYRSAYVIAVEPANVIPGEPSPCCPARGAPPELAAFSAWTNITRLTRVLSTARETDQGAATETDHLPDDSGTPGVNIAQMGRER